MKDKHIQIRIQQCLENAKASNCVRRKFGCMIVDPERNVILSDGYNGAPRCGGELCGFLNKNQRVSFCERTGCEQTDFEIIDSSYLKFNKKIQKEEWNNILEVHFKKYHDIIKYADKNYNESKTCLAVYHFNTGVEKIKAEAEAKLFINNLLETYKPIESGEKVEVGCIHAEANAIINACNNGNPVKGAWLFVNGECCLNCAKLIVNSEIAKVFVVSEGYIGNNGCDFMKEHGVDVKFVSGPKDPRGNQ